MNLDAKTVARLKLPEGKDDTIYWDTKVTGLGLRLRRMTGGALQRTWIYQYRFHGTSRRYKIGSLDELNPVAARDHAQDLRARVRLGQDPQQEKEDQRKAQEKKDNPHTLAAVTETYLDSRQDEVRARTYVEIKRYLTGRTFFGTIHSADIATITRRDVALCINEISKTSGKTTAARARSALLKFFAWCMQQGIADGNPVIGTAAPKEPEPRDRVLSDSELLAVWRACGDDDFGGIIKLCILLAQRRSEIGGMRRSELDLDKAVWSLPKERTKNGKPHAVPLPEMAVDIIRSVPGLLGRDHLFGNRAEGFTSWGKAKTALDARAGIAAWTIHDLRRSAASGMGDIGILPHIVEQILNHQSGHRRGVAGIYNKSPYANDVVSAMLRWSEHIRSLVEGGERKVLGFPQAASLECA
jgi:integrase